MFQHVMSFCLDYFDYLYQQEEEKKQKQEVFDVWETLARRRSLGNIRFIGELFKLKVRILPCHYCVF